MTNGVGKKDILASLGMREKVGSGLQSACTKGGKGRGAEWQSDLINQDDKFPCLGFGLGVSIPFRRLRIDEPRLD